MTVEIILKNAFVLKKGFGRPFLSKWFVYF